MKAPQRLSQTPDYPLGVEFRAPPARPHLFPGDVEKMLHLGQARPDLEERREVLDETGHDLASHDLVPLSDPADMGKGAIRPYDPVAKMQMRRAAVQITNTIDRDAPSAARTGTESWSKAARSTADIAVTLFRGRPWGVYRTGRVQRRSGPAGLDELATTRSVSAHTGRGEKPPDLAPCGAEQVPPQILSQ
jgi:hypothetical protein